MLYARLAQLVERWLPKPKVASSRLVSRSKALSASRLTFFYPAFLNFYGKLLKKLGDVKIITYLCFGQTEKG